MNINIKGVKDRVTHIKYLDYIAHLGLQKTFHRNSFGRKRLQYSQHSYSIKVFTFNCSILGPHFSSFCKSQLCTLSPNLVHTDHDGSGLGGGVIYTHNLGGNNDQTENVLTQFRGRCLRQHRWRQHCPVLDLALRPGEGQDARW
jgi:hypothetical protein